MVNGMKYKAIAIVGIGTTVATLVGIKFIQSYTYFKARELGNK